MKSNNDNNIDLKSKKLILAFGDSLTKGYYNFGLKYHPYSIKMNKLLEENNYFYKVIDSGVNGEGTTKMLERIQTFFEGDDSQDLTDKFSLVIIYAGTNDLGSMSYDKIAENIIKLHKYVIAKGVPTVLVTLPQNQCDLMYDFYGDKRHNTNEILREAAKNIENLTICDLDSLIKYKSMNKSDRKKYWDDHLHYSPEGYDLIGEYLFDSIRKLL
jgi:lysophospholipase L1-like esterase